ncbi:MAG: Rrf2 family transcriptional regulator [Phycisphaerae bacterium]|nr:Rrf2 family transcriptional regulator [Phycisphaerae bacterium]
MFRNKASTYAVLAVLEIAKRREAGATTGIQAGEIAEVYGLPTAYAAKVMSQLARSRILRSDRGPRGGFQLVRDAKEITMLEVIEAVNGIIDGRQDAEQSGAPAEIQSGLSDVFGAATDKVREVLGAMTIGKFVEGYCRSSAGANA